MPALKPIFLFSDSQMLFWQNDGELFLKTILNHVSSDSPRAAYIGVSNGDVPDFYQIFVAGMKGIGIENCKMISANCGAEELDYLENADIILLAGGDVDKGWGILKETGMLDVIQNRYRDGAVLLGISAGAVQLGQFWLNDEFDEAELQKMAQLLPFSIDAHEEENDWERLKTLMQQLENRYRGIGLTKGAGVICYPNRQIQAIRYPIVELINQGNTLIMSSLDPKEMDETVLH